MVQWNSEEVLKTIERYLLKTFVSLSQYCTDRQSL
jgi:hypothetical protein